MEHIMHFRNGDELSYAASLFDTFVPVLNVSEDEFDGDEPYELIVKTRAAISQAKIKRIVAHFAPKDHTFNQAPARNELIIEGFDEEDEEDNLSNDNGLIIEGLDEEDEED